MKKFSFLFLFLVIIASACYPQKAFVPSAREYVVFGDSNYVASEPTKYNGEYVYMNPGYDEYDRMSSEAYMNVLYVFAYKDSKRVFATLTKKVASAGEIVELDTKELGSPGISGNDLITDEFGGKFIVLSYKEAGKTKKVKGLLRRKKDDTYEFYEKMK
ncbi:hypothetical protein D4R20_01900 [bacterium]|nr:MAG: hypothetical protein D4R20_01900 [bacterium]